MLNAENLAEVRRGRTEPDFFTKIDREDLRVVLTPHSPWAVITGEMYLEGFGLPGNGGLGMLMGDFMATSWRLGLPVVGVTLGYPQKWVQTIGEGFSIRDEVHSIDLQEKGLIRQPGISGIDIRTNGHRTPLAVHKTVGEMPIYALSEDGLRHVYADTPDSDHRTYQLACLGFGGSQLMRALGLTPAVQHLNEAAAFGFGLAKVDSLMQQGMNLDQALLATRSNTLFSNHTLEPAASGSVNNHQLYEYVLKNMGSQGAKDWVSGLPKDEKGNVNLGLLSMAMAGRLNGVSMLHAEIASRTYRDFDGSAVQFTGITNGIDLARWVAPELYRLYQATGVYDKDDLPSERYQFAVNGLNVDTLRNIKEGYRRSFREYLAERKDQYGQPIRIPDGAMVVTWAKRLHGYKRPELLLHDIGRLVQILEGNNMHIIITGKAHSTDKTMKDTLGWMLARIDGNDVLKQRVHFVQNYDEELAGQMVPGVDIWCNTPVVGKEACGTSWEKAIANLAVLISTEDGGVADVRQTVHYLKLEGDTYHQEVDSLYANLAKAGEIVGGSNRGWGEQVKLQLRGYASTISGARMIKDYFNLIPRGLKEARQPFLAAA